MIIATPYRLQKIRLRAAIEDHLQGVLEQSVYKFLVCRRAAALLTSGVPTSALFGIMVLIPMSLCNLPGSRSSRASQNTATAGGGRNQDRPET